MIDFNIKNRYSGKVMFTAPIAADDDTPLGVKIGLAVKWALGAKKSLDEANLVGADLIGADLIGADLADANLTGAYLAGANLTGATLDGATLDGATLTRATLTGASLIEACLAGADLTGANLTGATLTEADLTGADLTGANLDGAYVHGELVTRVIARLNREIDHYSFVAFELQAGGVKVLTGCRWFTVAEYRAHVAANYPNTDKATETARILDYIEARAADLGIALEPPARKANSVDTLLKLQSAEARARELEARVEALEKVLREIADRYEDVDLSHRDFRVEAVRSATQALVHPK